jgi:hypothetical protein
VFEWLQSARFASQNASVPSFKSVTIAYVRRQGGVISDSFRSQGMIFMTVRDTLNHLRKWFVPRVSKRAASEEKSPRRRAGGLF